MCRARWLMSVVAVLARATDSFNKRCFLEKIHMALVLTDNCTHSSFWCGNCCVSTFSIVSINQGI